MTEELKKTLGISAGLIATVVIITGAYYIYRSYKESILIDLQIKKLRKEIG